ncbi:MAG: PocR ligand-binding domain-containing protein [Anaerolineae bacterium]|jgi:excisionase family DNA binding protein
MNTTDALLTTRQLQELLQVDRITIYRMLDDGRLEGFKVGGQWRFSRQAIDQWLEERRGNAEGLAADAPLAERPAPSSDTLPLTYIKPIQDIFAEILGLGTVTTAVDGTPLTEVSNSCQFCDLILGTAAGRKRCMNSWRAAAAHSGASPQPATCHAGLHYVWGRIEVQGQFVAALHAGQFLAPSGYGTDWSQRPAELAHMTEIDAEELSVALDHVPVLDGERQQQLPRLLQRVASTFSAIGEERYNLLSRLRRIAEISEFEHTIESKRRESL